MVYVLPEVVFVEFARSDMGYKLFVKTGVNARRHTERWNRFFVTSCDSLASLAILHTSQILCSNEACAQLISVGGIR